MRLFHPALRCDVCGSRDKRLMEVETSIGDLSESILEPGGAVEPVTTKVWVCRICWLAGYGAATTQVSE